MKGVELYGRVRYADSDRGLSHRAAARRLGIDPSHGRQNDEVYGAAGVKCAQSRRPSRKSARSSR